MQKITFLTFMLLTGLFSFAQGPIITMISDGDCSGGNPKVLEIYAQGTVDFSLYSLENQTNANTTWGNALNLASLGTLTDAFAYVYADDPSFATEFPSATNTFATTASVMSFNGDDRIRLVLDSNPGVSVDEYGVDSQDGTGEVWEYKDGYSKRKSGTTAGTFAAADWDFYNGSLDGLGTCQGGATFESIIGLGTYTTAGTPCPLSFTITDVSCDAKTSGTDTYTVTASFSGGGTETYTLNLNEGTLGGDDANTQATGTVTISGITEGTDLNYTITSANCNISGTITSPTCDPSTPIADLATLRTQTLNEKYILTGEAVLTMQQSFRGQKYIQDATAAILIDDNNGIITTTYNIGDGITGIEGTLTEFGGIMQFVPETDPGAATSTGNNVAPQILTISAYNANPEMYESELIAFQNVTITEADGTATFATGTNYTLNDGNDNTVLRTNFYSADYIGTVIAGQYQNVVGIASSYDDGTNVTAQIFPRSSNDFNAALSTQSIELLSKINMYPNPAKGAVVNLEYRDLNQVEVSVYTILGERIFKANNAVKTIDVSNFAAGMYLVQIKADGNTVTQKLIVE
ncbi:T9SS type A sorting domain-containing protein [Mesonia sp. HuA40]|uniref:T9SS type A sorting domain-containing protein n=1 Tax=Mesonia sp. HuA40 TaxID=2602761 RepID=UPI00164FFC29|nr:T9SS type A sorting domain-containing protein [Mesonia sp. HuA40]